MPLTNVYIKCGECLNAGVTKIVQDKVNDYLNGQGFKFPRSTKFFLTPVAL
jgi:hypothetical protein